MFQKNIVATNLEPFFLQFKPVSYNKGEHILRPGEELSGVFFIVSGYIRVYFVCEEGKEFTLNILGPGSYFPLMWLICDIPNRYFFQAMTQVTLKKAPKNQTMDFMKKHQGTFLALSHNLLMGINGFLERLQHLVLGDSQKKVAGCILFFSQHFSMLKLPLSHTDISTLSGLCRETVSLELLKLKKQGIIKNGYRFITIEDLDKLQQLIHSKSPKKTTKKARQK